MDGGTDGLTDEWQTNGWMDVTSDGMADGRMNRRTDGLIGERKEKEGGN